MSRGVSHPYSFTIAGVKVASDRPAVGLPDDGPWDTDVHVTFVGSGRTRAQPEEGWHEVEGSRVQVFLDASGRQATIRDGSSSPEAAAEHVRWVVPLAAALQGRTTLLGTAFRLGDAAFAVVTRPKAGAGSLVAALRGAGCAVVAEELVACRFDRAARMTVLAPGADPLLFAAVYFVDLRDDVAAPALTTMSQREVVDALVLQGLAAPNSPKVWRTQFHAYADFAAAVKGYALVGPAGEADAARLAKWLLVHVQDQVVAA